MADLVDALLLEDLGGFRGGVVENGWYRAGDVRLRVRPGGALLPWRYAGGPVFHGAREVTPVELVHLIAPHEPHVSQVADDVAAAVRFVAAGVDARGDADDSQVGERLAAWRNRPFHPAARAVTGWNAAEFAEYGPFRREPLALEWVAVRRDLLRFGSGSGSLAELVPKRERERIEAGTPSGFDALPVHPWQLEQVLPREFSDELASGAIRRLGQAGAFRPTSSLRTLAARDLHVKLPLGVATLGATRLLPPRYLANGEHAERVMQDVLDRDPLLRKLVAVCDERTWCGWAGDEFADRPGHLAAQLRRYPSDTSDLAPTIPMGALAAPEWYPIYPVGDPVVFFAGLAEAFCELAARFLRFGVLPELHGQNVLVTTSTPHRFVLRDHDTLRFYPQWMDGTGVAEPAYRIKPGAPQSLRMNSAEELIGYFQTLGVQVNLYGIADALSRHYGVDERALWKVLRKALDEVVLTRDDVLRQQLLDAPEWPSRQVLGPLLRKGASSGVSMPAQTGRVPNPLRT